MRTLSGSSESSAPTNLTFVHGSPAVDIDLMKECKRVLEEMEVDSLKICVVVGGISEGEMKSLISGDKKSRALYVDYLNGIFLITHSDF